MGSTLSDIYYSPVTALSITLATAKDANGRSSASSRPDRLADDVIATADTNGSAAVFLVTRVIAAFSFVTTSFGSGA